MIQLLKREIEYGSRADTFRLWGLSDLHIGSRATKEAELKATVEKIDQDERAYWVGLGDYAEFINITDKRFDPAELPPWVPAQKLGNFADVQRERVVSILKPIAKKCLGIGSGNHERAIYERYARDIGAAIAADLGVDDLGDCGAFIRLTFRRREPGGDRYGSVTTIDVAAHHGYCAGRKPGALANALLESLSVYQADIVMIGHAHRRLYVASTSYAPGQKQVYTRKRIAVCCGTFLDGAAYGQRKMLAPSEIGAVCIEITPDKRGLEVRL